MTHPATPAAAPRPVFDLKDAVALIVGIVVGAGIFKLPALVASNTGDAGSMMFAWILGAAISIIGALCYAELATSHPNAGGEYHFLERAFGRDIARLFAWARLAVIGSGSIAIFAFVFADYATQLAPLGAHSESIYAALLVVVLTAINLVGIRAGKTTQNLLTVVECLGLVLVIVAGLVIAPTAPAGTLSAVSATQGRVGPALISIIVAVAATPSANATILTGARTGYALGRDWPLFSMLGRWDGAAGVPRNAMGGQARTALALIALGA